LFFRLRRCRVASLDVFPPNGAHRAQTGLLLLLVLVPLMHEAQALVQNADGPADGARTGSARRSMARSVAVSAAHYSSDR